MAFFGLLRQMGLTETQKLFLGWNAERLGITLEESRRRYSESWRAVDAGHAGERYRRFSKSSYQLFQVFYSDTRNELYESYEVHALMHFLRMLSYPEPRWNDAHVLVQRLAGRSHVDILDFGCGLAQRSRSLAAYLKHKGTSVRLFLADIATLRREFLLWCGAKTQIPTVFLPCTRATPVPALPACDLCIATDFFEHVHDPLMYLERFHAALNAGGLLQADIADHEAEFMHVSPHLGPLRERVRCLGYQELVPNEIYVKQAARHMPCAC